MCQFPSKMKPLSLPPEALIHSWTCSHEGALAPLQPVGMPGFEQGLCAGHLRAASLPWVPLPGLAAGRGTVWVVCPFSGRLSVKCWE